MSSFLFIAMVLIIPAFLSWPVGKAMAWAMDPGDPVSGFRGRLARLFGRIVGGVIDREQGWKGYCLSLLFFNAAMFVFVFAVMALQRYLPLNPDGKGALDPSLIFNTAASFVTNTNLQHYSGEVSMSYVTQLFALMWLQFVSAGTGIAALGALSRGLSGRPAIGNFYRDLLNATLLVLFPIAVVIAALLVLGGVPMTFDGAATAETLEGALQTIARGPAAAFVAIKQLGTNGGGFFGPNSTHPFENPTFFTNIVENVGMMLIPMSSVWMFGRITRRMRHAAVIFGAMAVMLVCAVGLAVYFESAPTAAFTGLPVENSMNLEGKELRFGPSAGPFWAAITTNTSTGAVNTMHDSLNPLTGLVPLIGMWLNVIFGGVGVGLVNMLVYIVVAVFICGMMVGRTPEYLTKKVETREMKLALLALLVHPLLILGGTALFAATPWGAGTVLNSGAHGFTEIMYEFTSAAANNGSGFEGLGDATAPWNIATGLVMLLARYIPIILPLAIAGSLAAKKSSPETSGTLRTDTLLFGFVILGAIVLIGALLFMPVAVLGPINDHLSSMAQWGG